MRRNKSLWLAVISACFPLLIFEGEATKCYVCDTLEGKCPEDSVEFTPALQCPEEHDYCMNRRVSDGQKTRFLRMCTTSCEDETFTWQKGDNRLCQTCCSGDMCNVGGCKSAAISTHPSMITPAMAVAMTALALALFPYA